MVFPMMLSYTNLVLFSVFLLTVASKNIPLEWPCPIGKFSQQRKCVDCPPGTYNNVPGVNYCKPCPAGTFNPFYGSQGVDICQICPENTFSKSRASTCKPCPAGTNSLAGNSECLACGPGTFLVRKTSDGYLTLEEGPQLCGKCTEGYFSSGKNNVDCKPCPLGFSSPEGAKSESECSRCPPGSESFEVPLIDFFRIRSNSCFRCSLESFNPPGGTSCRECPPGTLPNKAASINDVFGSTKCSPCPSGTFIDRMDGDDVITTICHKCPKGMIAPGKGNAVCRKKGETKCPDGFFKAKDSSCRKCGYGWRYDRNNKKCIMCPEDRVSSGRLNEKCTRCPLRSMPDRLNGRFDKCICRDNFYMDNQGKCSKCPPGKEPSDLNHFNELNRDRQTCFTCRFDSFSSKRGMPCQKCPLGTLQHPSGRRCEKCPKGFYPNPEPVRAPGPRCLSGRTGCPKYTKRIVNRNRELVGCERKICPKGTFREPVNTNYIQNRKTFGGCRACDPGEILDEGQCVRCGLLSISKGGVDTKCVRCGKGTIRDAFDGSKCVKGVVSPYQLDKFGK